MGAAIGDGGEFNQPPENEFRADFHLISARNSVYHPSGYTRMCFHPHQAFSCTFPGRLLTPFMLPFGRMALAIRDNKELPAPSIVDSFCRPPWLEYAAGSVEPPACHLVRKAAGVLFAAMHEDEQNDSKHATTPDGPADVKTAEKWPRSGERALRRHGGRSNSRVQ